MSSESADAGPVRAGEELDLRRLEKYLSEHLPELRGPLIVEQFPHGHSNLTYLLRSAVSELVLRRPPFGNQVQTAHDMGREYRVLSKLSAVFPLAPRPCLFCDDRDVLGGPFYVMERRQGLVLRKALPPGIELSANEMRALSGALIDTLARLHAVDYQAAGLADLGKPAGYVARQVSGWTKRFENARTDDLQATDEVAQWLAANLPPESGVAIVHNDYKFDNLMLNPREPTQIVAVLDWEMATLGDPLMDLGTTLGYWVEAGDPAPVRHVSVGPTALTGSLTRRELAERYSAAAGREVGNLLYYYVFGLFKIAVILQQIYARFVRGHTHDPRFAQLNQVVAVMSQQAARAIAAGQI